MKVTRSAPAPVFRIDELDPGDAGPVRQAETPPVEGQRHRRRQVRAVQQQPVQPRPAVDRHRPARRDDDRVVAAVARQHILARAARRQHIVAGAAQHRVAAAAAAVEGVVAGAAQERVAAGAADQRVAGRPAKDGEGLHMAQIEPVRTGARGIAGAARPRAHRAGKGRKVERRRVEAGTAVKRLHPRHLGDRGDAVGARAGLQIDQLDPGDAGPVRQAETPPVEGQRHRRRQVRAVQQQPVQPRPAVDRHRPARRDDDRVVAAVARQHILARAARRQHIVAGAARHHVAAAAAAVEGVVAGAAQERVAAGAADQRVAGRPAKDGEGLQHGSDRAGTDRRSRYSRRCSAPRHRTGRK